MSNNYSFSCFVNVSKDSLSEFAWKIDHPNDPNYNTVANGYVIAVIVFLILLVGLPWNTLVICTIIKKRLYTQPTVILMLNLTITNFLLCVLIMPFNIISGLAKEFPFGSSDSMRCKICQTGIIVIILPWVSLHTTFLLSVDRFIYLKRPLKYGVLVTPRRILLVIALVWMLCIAISLPPLFGFGEIQFSFTVAACVPLLVGETPVAPNSYYVLLMLAETFIPVVTLITMYILILWITRKNLLRRVKRSQTDGATERDQKENRAALQEHNKRQFRLVQLFLAIFTANIVTWLPMAGLALTAAIVGSENIHTLLYTIAYISYLSETAIHPILETMLIPKIRIVISKYTRNVIMLCGRSICGSQLRSDSVTSTNTKLSELSMECSN